MGVPVSPVPPYALIGVIGQDAAADVFSVRSPTGQLAQLTVGRVSVEDTAGRSFFTSWGYTVAHVGANTHVMPLMAYGFTNDHRPYVVVQLGDGVLTERLMTVGALTSLEAHELASALAEAVTAFHAVGLAHGVVSPWTTIMTHPIRLTGHAMGAPFLLRTQEPSVYTAPEHLRAAAAGESAASPAADIYALAATVYVSLGGHLPWSLADPQAVTDLKLRSLPLADLPGVAPAFVRVLRAAMRTEPSARPTAVELRAAFAEIKPDTTRSSVPAAVDVTAVRGAKLREVAATAVAGAVATKLVDGVIGVGSRILDMAGPEAVSWTSATTGSAGTSAGAGAAGSGTAVAGTGTAATAGAAVLTAKIVVAAAVVGGTGVGAYQVVDHANCGDVVNGRPAAVVLADASKKLETTTFSYKAQANLGGGGSIAEEGSADPVRRRVEATVTIKDQVVQVVLIEQVMYTRASGSAEWQRTDLSTLGADNPLVNAADPTAKSESLASVKTASRADGCDFAGTISPSVFGLPNADTSAIPFNATVDTHGRLTRLKITHDAGTAQRDDDLAIDATSFDFDKKLTIDPPQ